MEICNINKKITGWKIINKTDIDKRPSTISYVASPKRPSELLCDIKKAKINGETWTIFVGLLDGKPYEMFGGLSKYVDIPNKYKVGKIIKTQKSIYNLVLGDTEEDQMTIKDIANVFDNPNHGAFTRTISLALRHGCYPQYVAEQLLKDKDSDMTSFSKVMARVLKSYIKDGAKPSSVKCESCGESNTLMYLSGCYQCSCGWSKCL